MHGFQGVRNLRDLFIQKYSPNLEIKRNAEDDQYKSRQPYTRAKFRVSNDQSFENTGLLKLKSKSIRASPDNNSNTPNRVPVRQQGVIRCSLTNSGYYVGGETNNKLEEYLQQSSINCLNEQKRKQPRSQANSRVNYRISPGTRVSANQSGILVQNIKRDRERAASREGTSRDPSPNLDHQYQKVHHIEFNSSREPIHNHNNLVNNNNNLVNKSVMNKNAIQQVIMQEPPQKVRQLVSRTHFNFIYVVGRGGFGKVWKVEARKSKNVYAMKEMSKARVLSKKSVNSVMNERVLLQSTKHPFLVNMVYAFQDRERLYLIMDLLTGGDLRFHIGRMLRFKENQTKFFIVCLLLALEYLHKNNIIHRDVKPENLVLDNKGYLRVTDLGIARLLRPENSQDTSGTPGYMAPEVMCRQNHSFGVDYYAMGVIAYEFMLGRRPYTGRSRREIRDQILSHQVQIKRQEIPDGWSLEAADFTNRLLIRKPAQRLGFGGVAEVKMHPWLQDVQWESIISKTFEAPFQPKSEDDNYDFQQQQQSDDNDSADEAFNKQMLRQESIQGLFQGYDMNLPNPSTKSTTNSSRNSYYINSNNTSNTVTNMEGKEKQL